MQKGRASGKEARPFCIDLVLQGKTLCCWGMQQLANVCYERRLCKNSFFHYLSTISDQERKIFLILTVFAVICIERFFEGFVA
ncbi:hypothetical protein, partial [Citrobacter freundii]|uniref:hypothetical protein n=1 Tax=Citrobacter freundii TaxID=546 RepID=UPI00335D6A0D